MTVYVDDMRRPARIGRGRPARWSHLLADTSTELQAFAAELGLNPAWLQSAGTHREHYDVTATTRDRALRMGAEPVTYGRGVAALLARKKADCTCPSCGRRGRDADRPVLTEDMPSGSQRRARRVSPLVTTVIASIVVTALLGVGPTAAAVATPTPVAPAVAASPWPVAPAVTAPPPAAGATLLSGQVLAANQSLTDGARRRLVNQSDGNLVAYAQSRAYWAVFGSRTSTNNTLVMQADCNLVLYSPTGIAVWNTGTWRTDGEPCYAALDPAGGLDVSTYSSQVVWMSGAVDNSLTQGQTLGPGQHIDMANDLGTLWMQTDGNLVLYLNGLAVWNSSTFVAGAWFVEQSDGNDVVYAPNGRALWASYMFGASPLFVLQADTNLVAYAGGHAKLLATTSAPASVGGYPWWSATCTTTGRQSGAGCSSDTFVNSVTDRDPWNGGLRQCVSFVWWWLAAHGGNMLAATGLGNAGQWGHARPQLTNSTPTIGSVAWWRNGHMSPLGHVAIVVAVTGPTVTVAQYNVGVAGSYTVATGQRADGYIHLGF